MNRPRPFAPQRLSRIAHSAMLCLLASTVSPSLWAQAQLDHGDWNGPLLLQSTPALQEKIAPAQAEKSPIYLSGEQMEGQQDSELRVTGNARLRRADTRIQADTLRYDPTSSQAQADGNVTIDSAADQYWGSQLRLNVDTYEGYFNDVRYRFGENQAFGQAQRVDFIDRDRYVVHEGDYTTCQRVDSDPNWRPAWQIRAKELTIDRVADVGVARNGALEFMGVPILPVPYLSFPLSDKRKSGFLPPTVGLDSVSGLQYEQPYYWNIAPNRDATITTTVLARRGVDLGGKFRYLEQNFSGELSGRYMPSDSLRDKDRWSAALRHRQVWESPVGNINWDANLNRVSDHNYWRDFPRSSYGLAERLLPSELNGSWQQDDWRVRLRTLKWQTLQDIDSVILPPYDMLPQLNVRYEPWSLDSGFDFSVEMDTTRFQADKDFTNVLTDGTRSYALAKLSRPMVAPQGFLTPSVQLHASYYNFDSSALTAGRKSYSRVLPTFSIDSGLVFERDTQLLGRNLQQTLEPRAFYTYTPYKNQSMLPMYDTAELDFTFASIYSPNAFVGQDRIADNNLLTLGLTSRLIAADDGAELVKASVAQRLRFKDQRVTAPGVDPLEERWSDILLGGAVNWTPRWATNGVIQYNHDQRRTVRYTMTGYYKPGDYKVLSAGYRMKRDASKHVEFGWQWPISELWQSTASAKSDGRWYGVGRVNYSMRDKKLVDTVVGVEYSACCWTGRVVLERLQNSWNSSNTRVLFQLELTGLSRINIGSNPLNSLRNNVPYYQEITPAAAEPSSRFGHYE
ncbi:LPS-assembly protein LptD [Lampropedia puyangensis]|uniref:LPS-assembly protein LptD n=1 Tax=Lampropedia puyangensis TaxID=1330072 RepID=UPI001FCEDF97|nr:LPS-assembly protein LptD [Lampropedia puyangensis]